MKCQERLYYLAQNSSIDDLLEAVGIVLDRHRVSSMELDSALDAVEMASHACVEEESHA